MLAASIDLDARTLGFEAGRGGAALPHRAAPRDERDVGAGALDDGPSQRKPSSVVLDRPLGEAVEPCRFEKDHRVGIADGRQQQSVGPLRRRGGHALESRHVGEKRLDALRVVLGGMDAAAGGGAQHQGTGHAAPGTGAKPGGVIRELVQGRIDEPRELDLAHRLEALRRHADRRAADEQLRQRGVANAAFAEPLEEALGGAEHASVHPDVLAEHEHVVVLLHGPDQRHVHGLDERHVSHCALPRNRHRARL